MFYKATRSEGEAQGEQRGSFVLFPLLLIWGQFISIQSDLQYCIGGLVGFLQGWERRGHYLGLGVYDAENLLGSKYLEILLVSMHHIISDAGSQID